MSLNDSDVIVHSSAVSLFGGIVRTVAYQPSSILGMRERAKAMTISETPMSAVDDFEAVAELFVQVMTRNLIYSEDPVTVGDFITRVGDLLNAEQVTRAIHNPKSVRTLDNIPVSVN